MYNLESCINNLLEQKTVQNIAVKVGRGEKVICDIKRSSEPRILTDKTIFDMASVTKIVATTSLAMIACDRRLLSPSEPVSKFFDVPEDKRAMTVHNLLTHTMGIGHKNLKNDKTNYENVDRYILNIPSDVPIGTDVLYSCPGYILLGKIVEQIFEKKLNEAFDEYVAKPLGMLCSGFLPDRSQDIVNANTDDAMAGIVNDYNCQHLGGVCGNAGLFSNADDMTVYAKMLLDKGAPLVSADTFQAFAKNYTGNMSASRALGFLYVDKRYEQTGGLFPDGAIGHCGHTGQSVFVDLDSRLYVIVLSDATASVRKKYGKENYDEVKQMRHDLHAAIKADIEG